MGRFTGREASRWLELGEQMKTQVCTQRLVIRIQTSTVLLISPTQEPVFLRHPLVVQPFSLNPKRSISKILPAYRTQGLCTTQKPPVDSMVRLYSEHKAMKP